MARIEEDYKERKNLTKSNPIRKNRSKKFDW